MTDHNGAMGNVAPIANLDPAEAPGVLARFVHDQRAPGQTIPTVLHPKTV